MTRINDATTTITGALNDHDREATGVCSTGRNVHPANMIARALDADGHLMPDLPEPEADDGIWYLPSDLPEDFIVHIGNGDRVCIEDDDRIHVMKPSTGRAFAYALLAAADYAEEHANDQRE